MDQSQLLNHISTVGPIQARGAALPLVFNEEMYSKYSPPLKACMSSLFLILNIKHKKLDVYCCCRDDSLNTELQIIF